jgi:hypothetical protein
MAQLFFVSFVMLWVLLCLGPDSKREYTGENEMHVVSELVKLQDGKIQGPCEGRYPSSRF